jgi:hypothetical protein
MKDMDVWALQPYGVTISCMESFNSLLKRIFKKHRGYGEVEVIDGCSDIIRLRLLRLKG